MIERQQLLRGLIASAPDASDLVDVVIPSFTDDQKVANCPFMPRGSSEPEVGDTCLVALDEYGAAWVIAWQ